MNQWTSPDQFYEIRDKTIMKNGNRGRKGWIEEAKRAVWLAAIVFASVSAGVGLSWRTPELDLAARDWLLRSRGKIDPPAEIAIIAIDERSIARLGRFPWPRTLMARGLERISAARPKAITLDVLYSEPTTPDDDQALATAIARAGNVVVASQLTKTTSDNGEGRVVWLRPLPELESAAAGVGHVNVVPGHDGIVRASLLRQADDGGATLWAMAAETIRVAAREKGGELLETSGVAQIGAHRVPLYYEGDEVILGAESDGAHYERLRPARLHLDYVGPAGSFAGQTYSFSDLLEGKIEQDKLKDKYVLIGATAAALGDKMATPFTYAESDLDMRADELTPGIEILANSLSTILRDHFYREIPDWLMIAMAAVSAMSVYLSLNLLQGRREGVKQIAAMAGLASILWLTAYVAFTRWLIIFPLVPIVATGVAAAILSLLRRSLAVSAGIDARVSELALWDSRSSDEGGLSSPPPNDPMRVITRLSGAEAAAIVSYDRDGGRRLIACHGAAFRRPGPWTEDRAAAYSGLRALSQGESASGHFESGGGDHSLNRRFLALRLGERPDAEGNAEGELILDCATLPSDETLALCKEIAASFLTAGFQTGRWDGANSTWRRLSHLKWWPRGAAWKSHILARLQQRMISRSLFVERALRSIEDGLIIASADGCVTFANPRAAAILGAPERGLIGEDLFERLSESEEPQSGADSSYTPRETLFRLLVERSSVEREITVPAASGHGRPQRYILRLSAVGQDGASRGTAPALGIVATLSDMTRQYELQKAKNDVMALVSHEMRTPLTAIQGISEVLAKYEVEPQRRYEMHLAINDESKRLARIIDDYLDLTRLETGARPLRLESLCATQLLDRALLLLEPVAAQREIRIVRNFAPDLPALTADADLIARAVTNLLANAVKFSPPRHDVIVEAFAESDFLRVEVKDRGCGISPEAVPFIFEKFYRAPRPALPAHLSINDDDAPGAGLGLAFVRDIAHLHGGRVTVESEIGVGSVFTLRLPFLQEQFENHNAETACLNR
jgi:signal transduction histidine kinase/CHASE2 domain-containing sensor protein